MSQNLVAPTKKRHRAVASSLIWLYQLSANMQYRTDNYGFKAGPY